MLLGEGAPGIPALHGGMAVAGISCPSCHKVKEVSPTGTVLWRASTAVCSECHDEAATKRLEVEHQLLQSSLGEIDADLSRAQEALADSGFDEERKAELAQRIRQLEEDLQFVEVGNSIHNMHYADSLVQQLVEKLRALCRELGITEPTVSVPAGAGLGK